AVARVARRRTPARPISPATSSPGAPADIGAPGRRPPGARSAIRTTRRGAAGVRAMAAASAARVLTLRGLPTRGSFPYVPRRPATSPAIDRLRGRIHAVGLRSTGSRLAVLRRLEQARTPVTHADIVNDLAPQGFDRATIYRNLIDLTEAGLASRTDLGDHVWRVRLRQHVPTGARRPPHF